MKKLIILPIAFLLLLSNALSQGIDPKEPTVLSQPVLIADDDWKFEGTEHMMLLPENRDDPASRLIPVHFFRFPALEKSDLPPVVFLGAGPGEPYSTEVFFQGKRAEAWRFELELVNQKRDVILINQRGNSNAPGLQISNFRYRWSNGGTLDKPFSAALRAKNRREAYAAAIKSYQEKGVDLKGYDFIHFIDDIEAVRTYLQVEKLALVGNSFGSQWGLGYIQRYPEHVDRAIFSGIEPLDHNYDDPQDRWSVLEKINAYAQADPKLKALLPEDGVTGAFKTIIERLEAQPQAVTLIGKDGKEATIVVGADDLRMNYMCPIARSYVMDMECWPKYIMDMYNGDYRILADNVRGRVYNSSSRMINTLVNNSIDISKKRAAVLNSRPAIEWLGNVNSHYTSTTDICPAPKVSPAFRQHVKHDIPIIIIQGDMDLSTPYENALFLMDYLENGHLITVKRGYHNAKRALIFDDPDLMRKVYSFMDLDLEQTSFKDFSKELPSIHEMPAYQFWPLDGKPLYEREDEDN
ncbi:MAG: alpha/beta fold hydrolase [Bacteroidota bacterium]